MPEQSSSRDDIRERSEDPHPVIDHTKREHVPPPLKPKNTQNQSVQGIVDIKETNHKTKQRLLDEMRERHQKEKEKRRDDAVWALSDLVNKMPNNLGQNNVYDQEFILGSHERHAERVITNKHLVDHDFNQLKEWLLGMMMRITSHVQNIDQTATMDDMVRYKKMLHMINVEFIMHLISAGVGVTKIKESYDSLLEQIQKHMMILQTPLFPSLPVREKMFWGKQTYPQIRERLNKLGSKRNVDYFYDKSIAKKITENEQDHIVQYANATYPLVSHEVIVLFQDFLDYKRKYGTKDERKLYRGMDMLTFITRLFRNRPMQFLNDIDEDGVNHLFFATHQKEKNGKRGKRKSG